MEASHICAIDGRSLSVLTETGEETISYEPELGEAADLVFVQTLWAMAVRLTPELGDSTAQLVRCELEGRAMSARMIFITAGKGRFIKGESLQPNPVHARMEAIKDCFQKFGLDWVTT